MIGYLKSNKQIYKRSHRIIMRAFSSKKAKPFDDKLYSLLNKKIGNRTVGEMIQQDETNGCCYFYALLFAKSSPKFKLAHGYLHALDKIDYSYEPFDHAWVESEDFVYDTSFKAVVDKDYYYKKFRVEKYMEYSQLNSQEVAELAIKALENKAQLIPVLQEMDEFKMVSSDFVESVAKDLFNERVARRIIEVKKEQEKSK